MSGELKIKKLKTLKVAAKQKELEVKRKKERQKKIQFLNATFDNANGRRTLRYLMELSGYQKHSAVINPQTGELNTTSMIYNVARVSLYLTLRSFLHSSLLQKIEIDVKQEE